ncbi:hypothetical protein CEXT_662271 [Caerostris extrusa]|uniref:Uncharacterized protein n=1 Tax=Caerostris extrusa TaxID=172846 RepID=A0AAV4ND41_CAEEX|nr:hypothetical protein CEXT_662271 [Caerostris extrusa]
MRTNGQSQQTVKSNECLIVCAEILEYPFDMSQLSFNKRLLPSPPLRAESSYPLPNASAGMNHGMSIPPLRVLALRPGIL